MKATTFRLTTALVLALGVAAPIEAQGRGNGNGRDRDRDDDRQEVLRDRDDDRRDDRVLRSDDDRRRASTVRNGRDERGNGPSFCRSGRGHPVFGWEWCRDRGWDRSNNRYPVKWERRTWEDVIFRRDDRRTLDRRGLGDVLGSVILGRLDLRGREMGTNGEWQGRWTTTATGRQLWVTAGGVPIARLVDVNGDRRVDSVYLAER